MFVVELAVGSVLLDSTFVAQVRLCSSEDISEAFADAQVTDLFFFILLTLPDVEPLVSGCESEIRNREKWMSLPSVLLDILLNIYNSQLLKYEDIINHRD